MKRYNTELEKTLSLCRTSNLSWKSIAKMASLTECQRTVLQHRCCPPASRKTLEQIAGDMGKTKERVRQIQSAAIHQILPILTKYSKK